MSTETRSWEHRPVARNKNGKKKKPRTQGEYEYLVRWDGVDPKTGKPWPDTWEPTEHIGLVTLESYYAARLAHRPTARPKAACVSKPPFSWSPKVDAAIFASRCKVTTCNPLGEDNDTLVPLSDTATPSPLYCSSPPALAKAICRIEKRKCQHDNPNKQNGPPDATSTPVAANKELMPLQTELPPTAWWPLGRPRGEGSRLTQVKKRRETTSACPMRSSPFSSAMTEPTATPTGFMTPRSYANGEVPCHEMAPPQKRHGLVDCSPAMTPLKKRRRLRYSMNV